VQELIDELGIYFVYFDRAGYGESDPHPWRTVKSEAYDIEELADSLQLGPRFYAIGISVGAYPVWSCLKYIPHRHDDKINIRVVAGFDVVNVCLMSVLADCLEHRWWFHL